MAAKRLPNEHEAQAGAGIAAANAAALLSDADLLASAGSYGRALSLAVVALEESVKARTLGAIMAAAAQGRAPGFTEDDLRKIIYSSHQALYRFRTHPRCCELRFGQTGRLRQDRRPCASDCST